MKKYIFLLFLGFSMFPCTLTSCSDNDSKEISEYYCPMKCEAEKTYDTEGSCPVCGMDLIEKNN